MYRFIQCRVHLEDLTVDIPVLGLDHVSLHSVGYILRISLLIYLFEGWVMYPFIKCWVHLEDLTVDILVLELDHVSLHTVMGTS